MGQIIYVEGALSCTLNPQQEEHVLSIKDGWGDPAFDYVNEVIIFQKDMMEGHEPCEDGVDKPLGELLEYAKVHNILINGDVEVSGDMYGELEKHVVIRIKDSERSDKVAEIVNASTEELVEELKDRGVLPEDFVQKERSLSDDISLTTADCNYNIPVYVDVLSFITQAFTPKDIVSLVVDQINQGDPVWDSIVEDAKDAFRETDEDALEDLIFRLLFEKVVDNAPIEKYIKVNMDAMDIDYSETAELNDYRTIALDVPFVFDFETLQADYPEIAYGKDDEMEM